MGKKIWQTIHLRKFGYDVRVLHASVHTLGVVEGNQVSARLGEEYVINCAMYLCNLRFSNLWSGPILAVLIHSLQRLPQNFSFRFSRRNVILKAKRARARSQVSVFLGAGLQNILTNPIISQINTLLLPYFISYYPSAFTINQSHNHDAEVYTP